MGLSRAVIENVEIENRSDDGDGNVLVVFDALGPHRTARLTHVSVDAAEWIDSVVADRAPQPIRCLDPFHLIA